MKYWQRFIASILFLFSLPSIIYNTIRYKDSKISSLKKDLKLNIETFWFLAKFQSEE